MLRSGTVNTIRELAVQGKSIRAIAKAHGVARNTVRKYLRGGAAARARPKRPSKLDPYREQLRRWVCEDHLYNCEALVRRLQAVGYAGKTTLVKDFVRPLRPRAAGRQPVLRYETAPGEQLQFDWGEFVYEQEGTPRKLFGFTAVLSYSRLRYVVFAKRCDAPSLIRCLLETFAYCGGLPRAVLTDRMKTVLLEMASGAPHWHPRFQELVSALGITPRICKPYTPQTKGKVERSVAWSNTTSGPACASATWTTSIGRRAPGATSSMAVSTAPPTGDRWSCWPPKACGPCRRAGPGNASSRRNGR